MTMKIKTWKVEQIMHDMSKYGDAYIVSITGRQFGDYYKNFEDENGFIEVDNVHEIIKETEKAINVNIDGFKTWIPKSAIA